MAESNVGQFCGIFAIVLSVVISVLSIGLGIAMIVLGKVARVLGYSLNSNLILINLKSNKKTNKTGAIYINDCPYQSRIPIWLIVYGVLMIINALLNLASLVSSLIL